MTCPQILDELQKMSDPTIKRIFLNHGAKEPLFGVRVGDLKKIQKKIKKNYELSLELYNTGNGDARYLAGLIADETKMTRQDLQQWIEAANWYALCDYTVPWVAAETAHGYALALEWIDADSEPKQCAGWNTLASIVTIKQDRDLDIPFLRSLLQRVVREIPTAPNRTRYAMNSFVIAVGCSVKELTAEAMERGKKMGKITVDMGGTACKVPYAPDYIQKAIDKGTVGKKKKTARC